MDCGIEYKIEKTEIKTESKKPKICYCSQSELDSMSRRMYGELPKNYISIWAQKMKEVDPDGEKARKLAEKYSKPIK